MSSCFVYFVLCSQCALCFVFWVSKVVRALGIVWLVHGVKLCFVCLGFESSSCMVCGLCVSDFESSGFVYVSGF